MNNRNKFIMILITVVLFLNGVSQDINMKVILVDFYKGIQSLPEITVNPDVEGFYPLYFDKNPKPAHCYLGKYSEEVPKDVAAEIEAIVEGIFNKDEAISQEKYRAIKDQVNNRSFNLFMQGLSELKNFNFNGAYGLLKKSLEDNPNNDLAFFNTAKILNLLGKKNDAREFIISALALNPKYNYYAVRNAYLLKQLNIEIKPFWFKPKWRIASNAVEVKDVVWKYYIQAYLIFQNYTVQQLFELTNIEKKYLAVHVIAFNVLLHYAKLNDLMTDELKKIEEIQKKGYLIPFINTEILYYFPEQIQPFTNEEIKDIIKYYKDTYLD
ncbi:MAG: hypothetical protein Kow00108_03700 [Calditrichia bacterium]